MTPEVAKTVVSLLRGFTTLPPRTHLTLKSQRVSFIFFVFVLRSTNSCCFCSRDNADPHTLIRTIQVNACIIHEAS